jgi:hypothetical protein
MSSGHSNPDLPLSLGSRPGRSYDSRTGLGYGLTKSTYHNARQQNQVFPYIEDDNVTDDLEDLDLQINVLQRIKNKIDTPYKSADSLIGRSIDRVSMAGGNSPVAIGETTGTGMVPFPGMYKKRIQSGGGVNSPKLVAPGQYNRTGSSRGWSHAPVNNNVDIDYDEYDKEDVSLKRARKIVRKVLKSNLKSI